MLALIVPYMIGLLLGVPLTLFCSRFRNRSVKFRLGASLLVSVGIAITINASLELLDLVGLPTNVRSDVASHGEQASIIAEVESETSAAEKEEQRSWGQEQRFADGTLAARRTVVHDSSGEIVPHGPASTYHPNGQLKWTATFKLGKQLGDWKEYYADGSKEGEGNISEDDAAEEKHWYQNGTLKSEGKWRRGVKHGLWKAWYVSGQLAGEFQYQTGQLHGLVREWHPNGKQKSEAEFSHGILVAPVIRWNEQGTLVETPNNNSAGEKN